MRLKMSECVKKLDKKRYVCYNCVQLIIILFHI